MILSIFLTSVGISLGVLFYKLSFSKKIPKTYKSKDYLIMSLETITVVIFVFIYAFYLLLEEGLVKAFITTFAFIGIPAFFLLIPIIGIYSILKKDKKNFLFSSMNILVFYIFLVISNGVVNSFIRFSNGASYNLILFFIVFLVYLELGLKVFNFDMMISKITQNRSYINKSLIMRFNRVFNKYFLFLSIFVLLSLITTIIFTQTSILSNIGKISLRLGSMESIFLFTTLVILLPLIFKIYANNEGKKSMLSGLYYFKNNIITKKKKSK